MKSLYSTLLLVLIFCTSYNVAKTKNKVIVDDITDHKDFKKLLRTKTNVLVFFTNNLKESASQIKIFKDVAEAVKGEGTMVLVDCSGEAKKMCKKLKVNPQTRILKHYKDGDFHKDYDRKETFSSMINFMRDPTGDIPWEEDDSATDVVHISDAQSLARYIKKETKPLLVMFYAPWCGFCKILKPEYASAAKELKGHSVLAAIDVNRPENSVIRTQYNITGFPTMLFYLNGVLKMAYEGENNKQALIDFMHNPQPKPAKPKEQEWSDTDSEVVHLSTSSFDPVLKDEASVLVMFYAPWCGHCKKMKPEYEKAAAILKSEGISGMLAALDATKEPTIASRFSVKGYPTVKYFSYGEFKFDINVREASKVVDFMKDPKEPPPPPPPEKPWSEEKSEVVHLNEENYKPFLKKKKHVLVMFYAPWCGHCKRAKPEFAKAAQHFKDDSKVEFAAIDCTLQQSLCKFNDISGYPTLKYFNYYTKNVKPYDGGRTADDFIKFMSDFERTPTVNLAAGGSAAADVPKDVPSDLIKEITDRTFDEFISSKLSFVSFYAPWCSVCKTLKPELIKAAMELKAENFPVQFALCDASESPDVTDKFQISGIPVFKLFKNGKHITNYGGARTAKDIKQFIKEINNKKDEL